jgi:hypothetical protein
MRDLRALAAAGASLLAVTSGLALTSCATAPPAALADARSELNELAAPELSVPLAEPITIDVPMTPRASPDTPPNAALDATLAAAPHAAPDAARAPRPAPAAARAQRAEPDDDWHLSLKPYLWLATTTGDGDTEDTPSVPIDVSAADLFADFDFAFMWGAEVSNAASHWAFLLDSIYLRFQSERDVAEVTQRLRLLEVDTTYRLGDGPGGFELLGGGRWIGAHMDIDLSAGGGGSAGFDWIEPVLGARWIAPLGESWDLVARADAGGLGTGPDSSWQALAQATWHVSESFAAAFGWRYFALNYSHADNDLELTLSGPYLGVEFRF